MKTNIKLEYILTLIMVCLMVGLSEIFQEKELIFPEITALTIGMWLSKKRVWKTSKIKTILLIALYAIIGVLFVRYIKVSLLIKIPVAFILCAIGIILSKTTFAPMISACILPILLNTSSWIYPISATIMTIIVMVVAEILERLGYKDKYDYQPVTIDYYHEIILWLKRLIVIIIMSVIVVITQQNLFIAPPLIVGFVELSGNHKKLRSTWKQLLLMIVICSTISALSRYILCIQLSLPLTLAAMIATITLLICIVCFEIYFPPVGAMAILPMLINEKMLLIYPIHVSISFSIFIIFAFLIAKKDDYIIV